MSIFKPPTPVIIASSGGGGGGSGTSLNTSDASVILNTDPDTGSSNVIITTNNEQAIVINESQNVLIGSASSLPPQRLVVTTPNGSGIALIHESNQSQATLDISTLGTLSIRTAGDTIDAIGNDLMLDDSSIILNGITVNATGTQLNYLVATPGAASPSKALVLNSNSNISGINALSATNLTGILQTAYQPNINRVSNLNIENTLSLGGTSVQSSAIELNYVNVTPGSSSASKALVLDTSSNITGINALSASQLTGTIQTGAQPNITSLGTVSNLKLTGYLGVGTNSPSTDIEIYSTSNPVLKLNNGTFSSNIAIDANGNLKLNSDGNVIIQNNHSLQLNGNGEIFGANRISASYLVGVIETSSQPNITTIGELTNLVVNGTIGVGTNSPNKKIEIIDSSGNCLRLSRTNNYYADILISTTGDLQLLPVGDIVLGSGTSIKLNAGTITGLSSITATSITGTLATAIQSNITTIGTLGSLTVTNGISAGSLNATTITGTIQTANQSNITTIGTLGSLTVTNGISAGSLSATTITGTLQTASQTNITTVGTLTRVYTSGKIGIGMTNPAYEIDITSSDGKMLQILYNTNTVSFDITSNGDCSLSTNNAELILANGTGLTFSGGGTISGLTTLTATNVYGTIQTASQPNITTIGTLSTLSTTTILIGDTHTSNYDLSIVSNTGRLCSFTYGSVVVTNRVATGEYIINSSTGRIALDTDVDLVLNGGTIIGLDNISVTNLSTTITQASQPNITEIGTLTELTVSGLVSLTSNNATALSVSGGAHIYGDLTVDGDFTFGGTLSLNNLNLSTLSVTGGYTASSYTNGGTLTITGGTAISDNLYVGTTLDVGTSISLDGTVLDFSNLNLLSNITTGTVSANTIFVADSSGNLSGFNQLSATELYGSIETATQTSITRVGTLSDLNVSGYLGVGTITPLQQLEINSTTGDCLRLSYDKATSSTNFATFLMSSAGKLTITSSGGATTIPQISATQISLGNTSNTTMPLEIGFTAFVFSGAYAYNTSTNSKGTIAAGGTTSYNYSIRALGRILCTQSVDVTSDRRLKYNIKDLSDDYCAKFVNDTTPVSFNWKNGDSMASYGYIAQDLLRHGFDDLVNLAHDDNMEQEVDTDGLISPSGIKFTISYQHIIPILAKNQKKLMQENKELHEKVDKLMDIIQQLMR